MKGNNTLELNVATMMEAVQYWLDNKVWRADEPTPVVTAVKGGTGMTAVFVVELSDTPK